MVFSSAVFLFLFLPVVILLHTVIKNNKIREPVSYTHLTLPTTSRV